MFCALKKVLAVTISSGFIYWNFLNRKRRLKELNERYR